MDPRAVIFDLGGVVLGSPLHAIADFERELDIAAGTVNRVVVETGSGGAWSRLERGELTMSAFVIAFEADCAAAGAEEGPFVQLQGMEVIDGPRADRQ